MVKNIWVCLFILFASNTEAQTVIYSEDFQGGIPIDYTLIDNDGLTPHSSVSNFSDPWIALIDPDDTTATDLIVGSTSYFDPIGFADRWIITPAITLGQYGNFLYWEGKSHDASYPDGYQVLVSSTDTQISSFDTVYTVLLESEDWNTHAVDLSEKGYDLQTVYIAFRNNTYDGFKLYLDDISVEIEDPAGINEHSLNVSVYPNPFSDEIRITGASFDKASIYTMDGKLVLDSKEAVISTDNLDSGSYTLVVHSEQSIYRKRVIKR